MLKLAVPSLSLSLSGCRWRGSSDVIVEAKSAGGVAGGV